MNTPKTAAVVVCLCLLAYTATVASNPASFNHQSPATQWLWEPVSELEPGSSGASKGEQEGRGQIYTLQTGADALLRLPSGYWLRLSGDSDMHASTGARPESPEAPVVRYSQGNGLFVPALLQRSPAGNEWLLSPPVNGDILVLLENNGREAAQWRLSRTRPQKLTTPNTRLETPLKTANKSTWYHQRHRGSHLKLARVQAGDTYSVSLTGPGEWRLEARMLADSPIKWQRFFDIPVSLNHQYWRDWRLHPSVSHHDTLVSGQCEMISSQAESLHITLPEGEHTISFTAPRTMAARTMSLQAEGFFFSRNLTEPGRPEKGKPNTNHALPAAEPHYDEVLFAAFLNGEFFSVQVPPQASAISEEMLPRYAAARLIDLRYRYWRPLPVANAVRAGGKFELIDVALADPRRGDKRYVQQATWPRGTGQLLWEVNPGRAVELQAPDQRPQTTLKISVPVTAQPYDLALKARGGKTTVWRWRPDFIQTGALDLVRDKDLALIGSSSAGSEIATASTIITLNREDFPISLSHSAGQTVLFAPFYRQEVPRSLEQPGWERALDVLGREKMVTLLLSDSPPQANQHPDLDQRLELGVWHDWQPLRNWLRSYRRIWTRGVAWETFADDPLQGDQLSAIIERLDDDATHLLEQLLRGVAARDPDPLRRRQATDWLHAHYEDAGDTANLSALHSWQFQHDPMQQLEVVADWLVASGQEKMAVRLYRLAATSADHLAYQQASLDAGWLQGRSESSALLATREAVWRGNWKRALSLSSRLEENHPWRKFLAEIPADNNPVSWLQWAYRAPVGEFDRKPTELDVSQSAQTLYFHAVERDLRMQRALAEPEAPVSYRLTGPLEVQLSLSLQHSDPDGILSDWIEISANGSKKWFPLLDSKTNPGIRQLPEPGDKYIGQQRRVTLSLGPGQFELQIRPLRQNVLVSARLLSPLLLSGLVHSFQQEGTPLVANAYATGELLKNLDINVFGECRNGVSEVSAVARSASMPTASPVTQGSFWQAAHTLSGEDIASSGNAAFDPDIETMLLQLIWQWPQTGDRERPQLIAMANASAKPFLNQVRVRTYLNKLNEGFGWQLEQIITGSAGSRRVQTAGSSEHPVTSEREMLLYGGKTPAGERLHGYNQIGLFTRFREPTQVVFDLRQGHLPYREAPPTSIALMINDKLLRTLALPPLHQQFSVTIPAGMQNLRLRLEQPTTDHWVYVQAHAEIEGITQSLLEKKTRRYQMATARQPLEIFVREPRWLRITQYNDGDISQRFHYQAKPGYLQLRPDASESMALYRVFGWQAQSDAPELSSYKPGYAIAATQTIQQAAPAPAEFRIDTALPHTLLADRGDSAGSPATDGLFMQLQSRRDFDADDSADENEQFAEAGWRHRQVLNCLSCYWRSDVYARKHADEGIKVVGTDQWLEGRWAQSSWRWRLKQSLLVQSSPTTHWSWQGAATLTKTNNINEQMEHEYWLQAFARHLSADNPQGPVDNDIYTRYKDQHRHGVKLATTLRGRPWLDSRWAVEAGLTSNEDLNPFQPDHVQAAISWRQYWRPLAFTAAYRHRLYLADDDRESSSNRPLLHVAVNSLVGFDAGKLLQWALVVDYDLDRDEYGFAFSLNWDYSGGRGLRDFAPHSSSFHSLRSQEINANLNRSHALTGTWND